MTSTLTTDYSCAVRQSEQGTTLAVHVSVRAKHSAIRGIHGGRIKVTLAAVPEDNKANLELIKVLALALKIPTSHLQITAGHTSKDKQVTISAANKADVIALLNAL